MLAQVFEKVSQHDRAAQAYSQILRHHPTIPMRSRVAEAWIKAGQPAEALKELRVIQAQEKELSVKDTYQLAQAILATNLVSTKNKVSQWEEFEELLAKLKTKEVRQQLKNPWSIDFLEASYLQRNKLGTESKSVRKSVVASLKRIEADNPLTPVLVNRLAAYYMRLGMKEDAERISKQVIIRNAADPVTSVLSKARIVARFDSAAAKKMLLEAQKTTTDPAKLTLIKQELLKFFSSMTTWRAVVRSSKNSIKRTPTIQPTCSSCSDLSWCSKHRRGKSLGVTTRLADIGLSGDFNASEY